MFVLVCLLGGVIFGVFLLLRQSHRDSSAASTVHEQYEKVKLGLTADQVVQILGTPSDDTDPAALNPSAERVMTWTDKRTYTLVITFRGGTVAAKRWDESGMRR
jgi:hypothetical protein